MGENKVIYLIERCRKVGITLTIGFEHDLIFPNFSFLFFVSNLKIMVDS